MDKHPYDGLIETVADKMKEHEDDNLGFRIFEKVDKDLGLSRERWSCLFDHFVARLGNPP